MKKMVNSRRLQLGWICVCAVTVHIQTNVHKHRSSGVTIYRLVGTLTFSSLYFFSYFYSTLLLDLLLCYLFGWIFLIFFSLLHLISLWFFLSFSFTLFFVALKQDTKRRFFMPKKEKKVTEKNIKRWICIFFLRYLLTLFFFLLISFKWTKSLRT